MRLGHPIRGSICSAMEGGLHLRIRQGGERGKNSWIFKYTNPAGEKKKLRLGVYPDVGLAQAREAALGMRQLVSAGKDPKDDKAKGRIAARKRSLDTFDKVARQWHRHAACCMSLVGGPLAQAAADAGNPRLPQNWPNPNWPADPAGHHRIADVRRHFHQRIRTVGVRRAKCWIASPFRDERILNLEPPDMRSTDAPSQYRNEQDSLGK